MTRLREEFPWLSGLHLFDTETQGNVLGSLYGVSQLPSQERLRGAVDAGATMGTNLAGEAISGLLGLYEGGRSALGGGPFLDPAVNAIERSRSVFPYRQPQTPGGALMLTGAEAIEEPIYEPLEASSEEIFQATGSPMLATAPLVGAELIDSFTPGARRSTVRPNEADRPEQGLLFADEEGRTTEPAGPDDIRPFYSKMERSIVDNPQGRMPANQWRKYFQKQGVKPDELKFTGIDDFLNKMGDAQVTREEMLAFAERGRLDPNIIVRGDPNKDDLGSAMRRDLMEYGARWPEIQYDLAGDGQRPRLERPDYDTKFRNVAMIEGPMYREYQINLPEERLGRMQYGHWPRRENTMMHLRTTAREDAAGNPVFFIDEIQSDWHQQGRQRGYDTQERMMERDAIEGQLAPLAEQTQVLDQQIQDAYEAAIDLPEGPEKDRYWDQYMDLRNEKDEVRSAMMELERVKPTRTGIPEAPFRSSWFDMGTKFAIDEAIKRGDEYVAFPTGDYLKDAYEADLYVESMYYDPVDDEIVFDDHARIDVDEAEELGVRPELIQQARDAAVDLEEVRDQYIAERAPEEIDENWYIEERYYSDELGGDYEYKNDMRNDAVEMARDEVYDNVYRDDYEEDYEYEEALEEWVDERVDEIMDNAEQLIVAGERWSGGEEQVFYDDTREAVRDRLIDDQRESMESWDIEDLLGPDYIESIRENSRIDVMDSIVDPNASEIGGPVKWLDEMVPGMIEKFLKKNRGWNTELEWIDIPMDAAPRGEHYVPAFRITDEMRREIQREGQSLYTRPEALLGAIGLGAMASQEDERSAVRPPLLAN